MRAASLAQIAVIVSQSCGSLTQTVNSVAATAGAISSPLVCPLMLVSSTLQRAQRPSLVGRDLACLCSQLVTVSRGQHFTRAARALVGCVTALVCWRREPHP